jgi:hypothetical protein
MTYLLRAGLLLAAGASAGGCVVSVDSQGQIVREEKQFAVDGVPDLHLQTFDGSIRIQSTDRADVLVEIEKRGPTREAVDRVVVDTSQEGNRIEVRVRPPARESLHGFGFHVSSSARLIVSVPRRADISARTGDGAIEVQRVTGRLELRTGDGSIRASSVSGDLTLDTGDGAVTVDRAEGSLTVETGDGGVNVSGQLSGVKVHTGDGSVVYRAEPGTTMVREWDISTGDGSVALYLPEAFGAELDAHTGDGTIRAELDVARQDGDNNRRTMRGRIGDGGPRLRVRTGDGSITVRRR